AVHSIVGLSAALAALGNVACFPSLILFVLYLRSVARSVGESSLAADAGKVITSILVGIVSVALALVFPPAILVMMGAMLYGTYKYLKLLQYMAEQLRR